MYENDRRKKFITLSDFEYKTPTHTATTHAISKLNFQEIGHKLLYPQIRRDLLNLFQYSDINNSPE